MLSDREGALVVVSSLFKIAKSFDCDCVLCFYRAAFLLVYFYCRS